MRLVKKRFIQPRISATLDTSITSHYYLKGTSENTNNAVLYFKP